jgi:prephenate dehydrogenase
MSGTGPNPSRLPSGEPASGDLPPRVEGPVAVVGLGLMGGSLVRALHALPAPPEILGVDTDPVAGVQALGSGVIQRFDPDGTALIGEARTVVYAVPLGACPSLLATHRTLFHPDALITDVLSLKGPVHRLMGEAGLAHRFVGAHPMAGGEGRGFGDSRDHLFRGARVWLTADGGIEPEFRSRGTAFWTALGGEVEWTDVEEHDRRMAWVSHLPQLVSNALAGALDAAGFRPGDLGPGGRDMTRLAGSSPEMWKDLLPHSAGITGTGLTSVSRALNVVADLLARREVDRIAEFMERTRAWSERGEGDE